MNFRPGDPVRLTVAALAARHLPPDPINRARAVVVVVGAEGVTVRWGQDVEDTVPAEALELALRTAFDSRPPEATEAA